MTTWSKEPPSEPGWRWTKEHDGDRPEPRDWHPGDYLSYEFGPRIPSPEAIEAAKDALREGAHACMMQGAHVQADAMRAALAKLEGRS